MAEVGKAVEKVIMRLDQDDFNGLKCGILMTPQMVFDILRQLSKVSYC